MDGQRGVLSAFGGAPEQPAARVQHGLLEEAQLARRSLNHSHDIHRAAAGAGTLIRASSQCSLIKLFSIRTTSKWFHLYSRLGSSGSFAVRSHIMNEYEIGRASCRERRMLSV